MAAAPPIPPSQMQSGPNLPGGNPSFTARKTAALGLGTCELPLPQVSAVNDTKFQSLNSPSGLRLSGSGSVTSVGNLLTPPNTVPGDGLSPTSAANAAAFVSASQANNLSYSQNGFWPSSAQSSHGMSGATASPPYGSGSRQQPWIPPNGMYSPSSMNSMARNMELAQPLRNGTMPAPDPFQQLPPFNTMSMGAPGMQLPAVSMQPPSQQQHRSNMPSGVMHQQSSDPSQMPPMNPQEPFTRLPPTPTYSNQPTSTSSPQPNSFSPSSGSTSSTPMRPPTAHSHSHSHSHSHTPSHHGSFDMGSSVPPQPQIAPQQQYQPRPYDQYNLPAVNGPVMTNMHAPHANLALVGGLPSNGMTPFTSGHVASLQAMYSGHQPGHAQGPISDRPFKCDQCTQSFNRNHDLKRHKRIHLAVKPYPCNYCDKSFSRKDALKVSFRLSNTSIPAYADPSLEAHVSKRMRQGPEPHGG